MRTAIQIIENEYSGRLRLRVDENNTVLVNAGDAARGYGYCSADKKGARHIKWDMVNSILGEFGNTGTIGENDYIPETLFYILAMRSDSPAATPFQEFTAKVIAEIRRNGYYVAKGKLDKKIMIRELGKEVRKSMTAAACRFYDYSRKFGDRRTKGMIIGQWTNEGYKVSGIRKGGRDDAETTIEQLAATILIESTQRDGTDSGIAQGKLPRQIEAKNSRDLQRLGAALVNTLQNVRFLE